MADRYSTTDIEGLADHLAPILIQRLGEHPIRISPNELANAALGWAADHHWRPEADTRRQVADEIRDMNYELGDAGWKDLEDKADEANYPREWVTSYRERDDFVTATIQQAYQYGYRTAATVAERGSATGNHNEPPHLAGFVRRAGIDVSDLDEDSSEAAIALGHWPDAETLAAFAEHAHFQWGDDTKRPTRIRRGWVVNAGNDTDWCLVPSSADVPAAFRVTYWEY